MDRFLFFSFLIWFLWRKHGASPEEFASQETERPIFAVESAKTVRRGSGKLWSLCIALPIRERFLSVRLGSGLEGDVVSFGLYAGGFAILICGLIYGAYLVHMSAHWIIVGAVVLLGVGILTGVKAARQKDPAA